ncbi:hypothetical protein D3871_18725 [Noviherbaspirillum saxi]|uniref:Uncharacterized protein n=1 Tax=Noviherbaspirillum saxi TaxID=2320863 RepID=A0A3A3FIY5_9BURK|nr:hypothetical protein D3871_18725 [Noviherbaspirillum saxi]
MEGGVIAPPFALMPFHSSKGRRRIVKLATDRALQIATLRKSHATTISRLNLADLNAILTVLHKKAEAGNTFSFTPAVVASFM